MNHMKNYNDTEYLKSLMNIKKTHSCISRNTFKQSMIPSVFVCMQSHEILFLINMRSRDSFAILPAGDGFLQ